MAAEDTTPQQRLELLQGLLRGTNRDSRTARALAGAHKRNVLIGAALHAADRLRQGKTPTDLEQKLLAVMRAALADAEIKDWGRVYRESVDSLGGKVDILPEVITGRPVTSGYSFADLAADFAPVAQEHQARGNLSVMDREVLAAGGDVDGAAFNAATREIGYGASAARTPAPADTDQPAPPPYRVKLELENFHVHRAVGDQGGGRDEIYWCVTSSSDKQEGPIFKSEEFGAVKRGETRTFSSSKRVVFDGPVSVGLMMHIMCWEADQSSSQWYDNLQKAMRLLLDWMFNNPAWQVGSTIGDAGLVGGYLLELIGMAAFFISIWRNEDDLSCERGFVLDQYTLAVMTHRRTTAWHFNGDGHHELRVKSTGDKVPFPVGTLEYAVRTGDTWGAPIALPWKTIAPPALASYLGKLHVLFIRPRDHAVMWTRLEGKEWSNPERIHQWTSYFAPALTVFNGRMHCAYVANDNTARWAFFYSNFWNQANTLRGTNCAAAPALGASPSKMVLTLVGPDGYHYNRFNPTGLDWQSASKETKGTPTANPVGLASNVVTASLYRAVRSERSLVRVGVLPSGSGWQEINPPTTWSATHGTSLAHYRDRLWLFLRAMDGTLHSATWNGFTWSGLSQVDAAGPITPQRETAAAVHNDKLYVMYHR
ncbi:hypothetical protein AB0F92_39475 [Kitasatospora aureofaciens]|uniref:hypothetical protein n=1 Tax=Kitasatospora aureofaciens TaxID=1894 RepID=UPI0033E4B62A